MGTRPFVDSLTDPLGIAAEFLDFEPAFAEGTGSVPLPATITQERSPSEHGRNLGSVTLTIATDEQGRLTSADVIKRGPTHKFNHSTTGPTEDGGWGLTDHGEVNETETEQSHIERVWHGDNDFSETLWTPDSSVTREVKQKEQGLFVTTTKTSKGRTGPPETYKISRMVDAATGNVIHIAQKFGQDELDFDGPFHVAVRDNEGRLRWQAKQRQSKLDVSNFAELRGITAEYAYDEKGKLSGIRNPRRGANLHDRLTEFDRTTHPGIRVVEYLIKDPEPGQNLLGFDQQRTYDEAGRLTDIVEKRYAFTSQAGTYVTKVAYADSLVSAS